MTHTLQYTATHCSTLQHTATHCNTLQRTATHCNTLLRTITRLDFRVVCLQCVAECCSVLQCVAVYCNVLQCAAVCCALNHRRARTQMYYVNTAEPAAGSALTRGGAAFGRPSARTQNTPANAADATLAACAHAPPRCGGIQRYSFCWVLQCVLQWVLVCASLCDGVR